MNTASILSSSIRKIFIAVGKQIDILIGDVLLLTLASFAVSITSFLMMLLLLLKLLLWTSADDDDASVITKTSTVDVCW